MEALVGRADTAPAHSWPRKVPPDFMKIYRLFQKSLVGTHTQTDRYTADLISLTSLFFKGKWAKNQTCARQWLQSSVKNTTVVSQQWPWRNSNPVLPQYKVTITYSRRSLARMSVSTAATERGDNIWQISCERVPWDWTERYTNCDKLSLGDEATVDWHVRGASCSS
jgi:hypothetical protein